MGPDDEHIEPLPLLNIKDEAEARDLFRQLGVDGPARVVDAVTTCYQTVRAAARGVFR